MILEGQELYPLKSDEFYVLPVNDAKRLLEFLNALHEDGIDDGWYMWFVGFIGAPVSIGQIDESEIVHTKSAERERCAKIAENHEAPETGGLYCGCPDSIAAAIRKGE